MRHRVLTLSCWSFLRARGRYRLTMRLITILPIIRPTLISVLMATAETGCVAYQAKPLTTDTVERTLAFPDECAIRVAASALKHPSLRSIDLDLRAGLSPEGAAVLAVIANPDLRAVRDRRSIAAAQVLQAGLLPNPQFAASLDQPVGGPDHFLGYSAGLSWDFTSLIGRTQRQAAAAADAASVSLDIAWQEWQIAQAAKRAAYDVLAMTSLLDQLRQAERRLIENRDLLRRAVERHERIITDLSAAEVATDDAHQAVLSAERDLVAARVVLNRTLGLPPGATLALRLSTLPSNIAPPPRAELLKDLESRRLDLLALKRGYQSQDQKLRAAILGQFPKVNLGFNTARDTADVRMVGLGVTIDIPLFNRNQGIIAAESATREKLFDEYASRVFAARSDIEAAIGGIGTITAQLTAAESSLPAFVRFVETYRRAMERGNADAVSLYAAEGTLIQKRINIVKLRQQLVQNWVALEIASGRYLPLNAVPTAPATRDSAR